jgi:peptide/nickel transport system permease protein
MAVLAPLASPQPVLPLSPLDVDLQAANIPIGGAGHLLGTDYLGRDIVMLALWGARVSLAVGILTAGLAVTFGAVWGTLSAFAGGAVDAVMMRLVDGLLAVPSLILVLTLQSFVSSPQLSHMLPPVVLNALRVTAYSQGLLPLLAIVVVISATAWLEAARIAHAQVLAIKSQEYILAAQALGTGTIRMMTCHLLPNAAAPLIVEAGLLVSDAVLMESGLSFLGLGLGPSMPSWGGMLASAQVSLIGGNWWAALTPGVLISTLVLSINLIGEGLIPAVDH